MGRVKDRVGEINYNTFGSKMIITKYNGCNDIVIYFPEYNWYYYDGKYHHFKEGNIKCPYERRWLDKGYIGEGEYNYNSDSFKYWIGILKRVYDNNEHLRHPSYNNVELYEPWHCFQEYGYWHKENYYTINGEIMELDKDILFKGNKIYSPSTCIYVPHRINSLFTKSDSARGDYPIGVTYHKRDCVYESKLSYLNKYGKKDRIYLGRFNNPLEAFLSYKQAKETLIKQVADEYRPYIPKELYEAMYKWKVDIND